MSVTLRVTPDKLNKKKSAVFVHPDDFHNLCVFANKKPDAATNALYVQVKHFAFSMLPSEAVAKGMVYFNQANRQTIMAAFNADVVVTPITDIDDFVYLKSLVLEVGYMNTSEKTRRKLDCNMVVEYLKKNYATCFFNRGQVVYFHLCLPDKIAMRVCVRQVESVRLATSSSPSSSPVQSVEHVVQPVVATWGILQPETDIKFVKMPNHQLVLENANQNHAQDMFSMQELSFVNLGIGGLDEQFVQIFRRAFASRMFPPDYMQRLGLSHVKGILMHGPAGCGKTLVARQLCTVLKVRKHCIGWVGLVGLGWFGLVWVGLGRLDWLGWCGLGRWVGCAGCAGCTVAL